MALKEDFSSEQFALRWNNFSYNLSSGFSSHLNTKNLVDVTLAVEGQLIEAHKLVLSVSSSYFEDIFKTNPCQHPIVILQGMKYSEIDTLIRFMYQGEVNIKQEDLARFLKVAEVLKVKGLTLDDATLQNLSKTNSSSLSQHSNELQMEESSQNNNIVSKEPPNVIREKKKHIQTNITSTRSSKRIKKSSITLNNTTDKISISHISPETEYKDNDINNIETISRNDNSSIEHLNRMETASNDESIDLTKDDDDDDNDNVFGNNTNLHSTNIVDDSSQQFANVEPVTYRLSARGRPQLIHKGYVYNLTSRSAILNRSHYRCAEQHRGCRGKCAVMAERFMPTGVNDHNHPPDYETEDNYRKKHHTSLNERSYSIYT